MNQLSLAAVRNRDCPYSDFIDDNDNHCNNNGMAPRGYVPLGEDSEDHALQIASVNGPYLDDIVAVIQELPEFPSYIPVVKHGSTKLFEHYKPEWVGVQLAEVLSGAKLLTAKDVRRRLGVPPETKVLLLAYGLDFLIENLWGDRRRVLKELAELGFDAVTAVNYSIWDMHPHPEKVFNVKRSLVTYQEFQEFGVTAIPHIYWYSQKSMELWVAWLEQNPNVAIVAIDMQTLKDPDWDKFIIEFAQFVKLLRRPLHFLATGPEVARRIEQLRSITSSLTLTNTYAAVMAWLSQALQLVDGVVTANYSSEHKGYTFKQNVQLYQQLMTI